MTTTEPNESYQQGYDKACQDLIAFVHQENIRASSEVAFVLGKIIGAMDLTEAYREFARKAHSLSSAAPGDGPKNESGQ